jgi:flagellar L-ring protein precursor FlgH
MKVIEFILIGFLLVFSLVQTGCAGFNRKLKDFLGGRPSDAPSTSVAARANSAKFSESPDMVPRVRRQYKRTTKETLAQESALEARAGSLWVMEGQGAYLFSQNILRLVGDPIAVQLDGDPKDQLNSKVTVIKKLLAKIEEKQKARLRQPAGTADEEKDQLNKKGEKGKADKSTESVAAAANPQKENAGERDGADFNVKTVPTRIVERTADGNYRVKGSQPFMVGAREYKVIVTGVVRAEDFNDEGISSTKLIDPKFDIVSARRKESEM